MKLVTWNCNQAFRNKFAYLEEFCADIMIIQECENPETTKDNAYKKWAKNFLWKGENNHKGLGIFANEAVSLHDLEWNTDDLKYFISCQVNHDIILLAIWCQKADTYAYIGQLWKYLQNHKAKFTKAIIAGDFNSNAIWDHPRRTWNHSDVVRELKELKIESLYHKYFNSEEQGKDLQPTFFLTKNPAKGYHIDYIFASESFVESIKTVSIGKCDPWLKLSDHMPMFCDI